MKLLLTLTKDGPVTTPAGIPKGEFRVRTAARAVLLDANDGIYLLKVGLHNYHKLPGGGIDPGETKLQALKRELLEEVGCDSKVISELGQILEYRTDAEEGTPLKQTSYCYLAQQVGPQKPSALEEGELAEGMHEVKAANIEAAIQLLENDQPDNIEGHIIQQRDLTFLKAAQKQLTQAITGSTS